MFDVGWTEMALIAGVAVVLLGPEDMPRALHFAGKCVRKIKLFTADLQASLDRIVHEAELDDITRGINEKIGGPNLQFEIDRQIAEEESRIPSPPAQRAGEGQGEGGVASGASLGNSGRISPPPDPLPPHASRAGERESFLDKKKETDV